MIQVRKRTFTGHSVPVRRRAQPSLDTPATTAETGITIPQDRTSGRPGHRPLRVRDTLF